MSPLKQIGFLAVLGVVAAGAWYAGVPAMLVGEETVTDRRSGAEAPRRAPVIVTPVRLESDAAIIEAIGTGVAARSVTLFPEAAGRVTEVGFSAGARVVEGDILLRLDAEEEELAVDLAKLEMADARRKLRRYEKVAPSGAVSTSEVDAARIGLSSARIGLAQAELALRDRTLIAPFSGVIGISQVDPGERVTDETPIASLDDRSTILVDFDVPESFAYGVREDGTVTATTWALPGQIFDGRIIAIGSQIDAETRTLRVRAAIPNESDALRTGMSFTVRLPLAGNRFPSVPSISVMWDRSGAYVWRVGADGTAERVKVDVLKRSDAWVLVDGPIEQGEAIVVEGLQGLHPGVAVEVRKPDQAAPAG